MLTTSLLIALAFGGCLLCIFMLVSSLRGGYASEVDDRLSSLPGQSSRRSGTDATGKKSSKEDPGKPSVRLFNQLVPDSKVDRQRYQARLFQAGIYKPSALSTYFAVKLGMMISPPLLGWIAGLQGIVSIRTGLLYGSLAGAFGFVLPSFWLDRRIAQRHRQLRRSLPDFLDLMIICLDGGLSLQGAIQRVGDELQLAHPELAREMQTVQRDVDLGATTDVALRYLAERTGLDNLRTLSTFVRESQRFGTELSEALRLHAEMLRNQREQSAEEQAQKAAVRILLTTLLLILPAVFVVVAGPAAIQIYEAFSKPGHP